MAAKATHQLILTTMADYLATLLDRKQNNIDFASIPRCELLIAGSGEAGVPREIPNEKELRKKYPNQKDYIKQWSLIEEKNQRFLINIVPVLGNIDDIKAKLDELIVK